MNTSHDNYRFRRTGRMVALVTASVLAACIAATVAFSARSTGSTPDPKDGQFHRVEGGELTTKRPTLRDARAPLSTEEIGYALHLAKTAERMPQATTDVQGSGHAQLLYVDLPPMGSVTSDDRLAVVMVYDYTSDRAYQVRVNLTAAEAEAADSEPQLQPPPAPDEAASAMQIAIESELALAFQSQFEQLNGLPLLSPTQVTYRAGIWTYDETTTGGKQCGEHRCVELLVRDPSGTYLDTGGFVVDLTARKVIDLDGGQS